MGERVRHLPPTVEIKSGDTGVIMTTTETTVREEAFVDSHHAVDKTKNRGSRAVLKAIGALALGLGSFGWTIGSAIELSQNLGNNNAARQESDVEGILLGLAGAYGSYRYVKRKSSEIDIGDAQGSKAVKLIVEFPRKGGMNN